MKEEIRKKAVLKKFETDSTIKGILLSTREEEIIKNATHDYYWDVVKSKRKK